ncbi:hypothetical protein BC940DRAFT_333303 [Gongronella butleri]|nr:hypothetical protein BC940DRAFT_333303 [Gongronella butleri]
MLEVAPSLEFDFFDSKMDETERRKLLSAVPRNLDRDQEPPKLPDAPVGSAAARQAGAALRDIQYRIGGLTRPLDWFIYQSIHANWTTDQLLLHAQRVARDTLDLLADVASHVSEVRVQGLLSDVKLPKHQDNLLITNDEIIELASVRRRLQEALQPPKPPSSSGKKGKSKRRPAPPSIASRASSSGVSSSNHADSNPPASSDESSVGFRQKPNQNGNNNRKQQQRRN